jgi:hypothetical protein
MLFATDIDAIACRVGAALLLADEAEHSGRTRRTSSARLPQSLAIAFILCRLHISRSHRRRCGRHADGACVHAKRERELRTEIRLADSQRLRGG